MTRTNPEPHRQSARLRSLLLGAWILVAVPAVEAAPGLHHDLTVRLDPVSRELAVEDTIAQPGVAPWFTLDRRFTVEQVLMDGVPVAITARPGPAHRLHWQVSSGSTTPPRTLSIRYRGRLDPLLAADHREVLHGLPPMADPRGSFLPGGTGWYPELDAASFTYRVSLDLPAEQRGLVPGRLVGERVEEGRYRATFAFTHPAEAIDLIAGPYRVEERILQREGADPLRVRTYLHAEIADLAKEYLSAIGGYVDRYSRWIGPYPFTEFSVVSSPLPTGFGMPTLTYLGVDVLRLPFIRQTSLGHEILHNWWGNGVYVDFRRGNWSEGLTAFMADYTYQEREGAGAAREARLGLLRDLAAVPPGQDTPLRQFTARSHGTSQIVGYHKATLLFVMLRDLIGTVAFDAGLQRFWKEHQFRQASWADLRRAFERASGRDLGPFFDQWLSRRGAPRVTIETTQVERTAAGYRIRIVVAQDGPPYLLTVPVTVATAEGSRVEHRLDLATARQEFGLEVAARPLSVALDPDFRVLRALDPAEVPPILRQVILDPATVTVLATPDDGTAPAVAADLARGLLDHPPTFAEPAALPARAPLLVIGLLPDVDRVLAQRALPSRPERVQGSGTAWIWTAYQANGKVLAVVAAKNTEALRALLRPLPHYGRQSYLIFDGARAVERGVWPAPGREWRLTAPD